MHQPEYRDLSTGVYQLPWTYLHVIKDYVDMVTHLENNPRAHAVVNFAPILLEQIDDYARQIKACLEGQVTITDPLLAALVQPVLPTDSASRMDLILKCLRAHEERMIKRFPAYQRLAEIARWLQDSPDAVMYIDNQYLTDLLVWHHLAWMGETVRRTDMRIKKMLEKKSSYTLGERWGLLGIIGELISSVIKRYRALAEQGQIELSMTPYAHPIMPLLLELKSAQQAMPEATLPVSEDYPGGVERVRWHIQRGLKTFEHYFGFKPNGCWPSEGSISTATLGLLSDFGFQWAASGGAVLQNSLKAISEKTDNGDCLHRPYRVEGTDIKCFFRDDGLSDLIGFTYSHWHADDAVANLVHHIENIANSCHKHPNSVVSIILDGENAWEHYPENGHFFLQTLYRDLSNHPEIELTTYSQLLANSPPVQELERLVAGSWVYGSFSTWIGDKDKNRGWDMLVEAKCRFDEVLATGRLNTEQRKGAELQLAICEGSDWFWWFGDYNEAQSVSDFEGLFRRNLTRLYMILGETPPPYLSEVFTKGKGSPDMGGTMRRGQEPTQG
jgi:alpha-amylase/alpha-mannosidase (GH57 family)